MEDNFNGHYMFHPCIMGKNSRVIMLKAICIQLYSIATEWENVVHLNC